MQKLLSEDEKIAVMILGGLVQASILQGAVIARTMAQTQHQKALADDLIEDPETAAGLAMKHVTALIDKIEEANNDTIPGLDKTGKGPGSGEPNLP